MKKVAKKKAGEYVFGSLREHQPRKAVVINP